MSVNLRLWVREMSNRLFPVTKTKYTYFKFYGRKLDLKNPQRLSEKVEWLKLFSYPKNPDVIQAADKARLADFLESKGLGEYALPKLAVVSRVEDIPWDTLPKSFVVKKSNGSGQNSFIKDKDEVDRIAMELTWKRWLKETFSANMERHYKESESLLVLEQVFEFGDEVRFFVMNGEVQYLQAIYLPPALEETRANGSLIEKNEKYYPVNLNLDWELIWKEDGLDLDELPRPEKLTEMLDIAKKVGQYFPFVRVDTNRVNGEIKITELTFTPSGALMKYYLDESIDEKYGKILQLPPKGK
jgi:hypothetical protein